MDTSNVVMPYRTCVGHACQTHTGHNTSVSSVIFKICCSLLCRVVSCPCQRVRVHATHLKKIPSNSNHLPFFSKLLVSRPMFFLIDFQVNP